MSNQKKILLIDDHHPTNFYHRIILEEAFNNVEVITLSNPDDAMLYIAEHPMPDMIFCDLKMPPFSGWEFVDAYEEIYRYSILKAPVMILSDNINDEDYTKAKEYQCVKGLYPKPLKIEYLSQCFAKAV